MEDTLKVEVLLEAMDRYAEASAEEREARERYDGYSWGYAGSDYLNRKAKAASKVRRALSDVVRAEVRAELRAIREEDRERHG